MVDTTSGAETETNDDENDDEDFEVHPPPPGYQEIIDGRLTFASMDDLVADVDDIFTEMEVVNWDSQMELD